MKLASPPAGTRKTVYLKGFLLLASLLPFSCALSHPADTNWSVTFRLYMSKAVRMELFNPETGHIHLVADHGMSPLMMVRGTGDVYTGTLTGASASPLTYHYKYRLSDTLMETVTRSFAAVPGSYTRSEWWNNDPVNVTTFRVNMDPAVQSGRFDPAADSVSIVGTMNNQQGSPKMQREGTTLVYSLSDSTLLPGTVHQYRYRINADSAGLELLNRPPRIFRVPDTLLVLEQDFENYNPARQPMVFRCDMHYYIGSGRFDPATDFLDVAGNFNGYGGSREALFDTDGDSIYHLETFLDTAWFHQGPLAFRFRINGTWIAAELTGKPDRSYAFHDSVQGANLYACYFNDLDPAIPTPPWAEQVAIQGPLIYKKFLSGIYSYANVNGIHEGISTYQWYRCNNPGGTGAVPIDSAWKITYTVDTLDISQWLIFEVTPKAAWGDSAVGKPVRAITSWNISAWDVGMGESGSLIRRIYPNPACGAVIVEADRGLERMDVTDLAGRTVLSRPCDGNKRQNLSTGNLAPGVYILRAITVTGRTGSARLVKLPGCAQ